jgi:acetyl-CoA C-acetyltransferase/acetyl-CoA acyltransferase
VSTPPVYLVAGARTAFCKAGTLLAGIDAVNLGRTTAAAVLASTGFEAARIDETIFGCVGQPIDAANIARVIALRAGVPESVPAYTVHRNCASGLEAVTHAADRIALGRGDVFLCGGAESMSRYPLLFPDSAAPKFAALSRARSWTQKASALLAFRPADFSPRVSLTLGLTDPVCGLNMLGQDSDFGYGWIGIDQAAAEYFAARPEALTPEQAALLAAVFSDPEEFHPWCRSATARNERNRVLGRMLRNGAIDEATHARAIGAPLGVTLDRGCSPGVPGG